jgi:hypothetical protein
MADGEVKDEDLQAHGLILFGRPGVNRIARRSENRFPIRFEGTRFTWQGETYEQPTASVVQVVYDTHDSNRLIMLCAGLSAEATQSICEIDDFYRYFWSPAWKPGYATPVSYYIYDRNKCLRSGDWPDSDPHLLWRF